jgi:uncharacterized protein
MPKTKRIKVIFDTNWYISVCINRNSRRRFYNHIVKTNRFEIYYSNELLTEFQTVIIRPKFRKYLSLSQANRLMGLFLPHLKKTASLHYEGVRDVKDNYLIGMCKSCKPDFLVTGDSDLLVLETFEETTILTMTQFLQILPLLI